MLTLSLIHSFVIFYIVWYCPIFLSEVDFLSLFLYLSLWRNIQWHIWLLNGPREAIQSKPWIVFINLESTSWLAPFDIWGKKTISNQNEYGNTAQKNKLLLRWLIQLAPNLTIFLHSRTLFKSLTIDLVETGMHISHLETVLSKMSSPVPTPWTHFKDIVSGITNNSTKNHGDEWEQTANQAQNKQNSSWSCILLAQTCWIWYLKNSSLAVAGQLENGSALKLKNDRLNNVYHKTSPSLLLRTIQNSIVPVEPSFLGFNAPTIKNLDHYFIETRSTKSFLFH